FRIFHYYRSQQPAALLTDFSIMVFAALSATGRLTTVCARNALQTQRGAVTSASALARQYSTKDTEVTTPTTQTQDQAVMHRPGQGLIHAEVTSGAPEVLQTRTVRIFRSSKSAMQSGLKATQSWRMDFDTMDHGDRWENQLMGWASTADFMHGLRMKFQTKEAAVRFAEKQGWNYYVQEPKQRKFKKMVYADNFTYSPTKLRLIRTK
ncbi:ndufs4 NADH dehydrogenase Fe-S protein subunit, partial [Dispira parvispora]